MADVIYVAQFLGVLMVSILMAVACAVCLPSNTGKLEEDV